MRALERCLAVLLVPVALGCAKEQYRDTGERFKPRWVRQSDGKPATREEVIAARDVCTAKVKPDTRAASEAFAADVWGFEMRKCMASEGLDLQEVPKQ